MRLSGQRGGSEEEVDEEGDETGECYGVDDGEGSPAAPYLAAEGGDGGDAGEVEQDEHHEAEGGGRGEDVLLAEGGD